MANRRSRNASPSDRPLPELRVSLVEAQKLAEEQLERGRSIRDRPLGDRQSLGTARSDYSKWVDYNRELLRRLFTTTEISEDFGRSARMMYAIGPSSLAEDIEDFRSDIGVHIRRLESVQERLPLLQAVGLRGGDQAAQPSEDALKRVFVVHGHDLGTLDRITRLLRELELEPVVLRDQPNAGRTIIEKFEAHADVSYAVVIMTGDDMGGRAGISPKQMRLRARQNVVLELGFFIGRLTRRMVAALVEPDVEIPSDIDGVIYIRLDPGDTWRLLLAKEMKAAGLPVDLNRL